MPQPQSNFSATRWTVVLAAGGSDSHAHRALSLLCERYWDPMYAFVRRGGLSPEDAEDSVQGFFQDLLQRQGLTHIDPSKGRFRSFMLASFKNYLSHERSRANAQKRGGGRALIEFDAQGAEERYLIEPSDDQSPDKLYDRRWALILLERAQRRLAEEYELSGQGELFRRLRPALGVSRAQIDYAGIAAELGKQVGAVKVAAHRLRQRYGQFLREEVAATVASPDQVDAELRHLIEAL